MARAWPTARCYCAASAAAVPHAAQVAPCVVQETRVLLVWREVARWRFAGGRMRPRLLCDRLAGLVSRPAGAAGCSAGCAGMLGHGRHCWAGVALAYRCLGVVVTGAGAAAGRGTDRSRAAAGRADADMAAAAAWAPVMGQPHCHRGFRSGASGVSAAGMGRGGGVALTGVRARTRAPCHCVARVGLARALQRWLRRDGYGGARLSSAP